MSGTASGSDSAAPNGAANGVDSDPHNDVHSDAGSGPVTGSDSGVDTGTQTGADRGTRSGTETDVDGGAMSRPHTFRVWAPQADQVQLVAGPAEPGLRRRPRIEMHRQEGGWWQVDAEVPQGRYAFSLDGGRPRPDPRSLRQPDGVHGPSAVVDLAGADWTDTEWQGAPLAGAVLYELHLGTFTPEGTCAAAIERLDDLVDLGVTMVSLLPVAAFPGRHGWGYDGVALYAVHEPYGSATELQRMVDACHARGLSVCLDVVYNHFGPSGNYLAEFGPYFTDRHHTPWGSAVNLDGPDSTEVRAFILDNVRMWLQDFHMDALRLDAVHELHDRSALHLLEEMAAVADEVAEATGVPRHLIAESDRNDPATVTDRGPGGSGGLGLAAQWVDDVHHALHVALTGEDQAYYADFATAGSLEAVLTRSPFFHDGTYSSFRGRRHGRPIDPEQTPGERFVASLQTHDQIGNRARGERLCHLVPPGVAAAGAALLLTSPYTPMLFMGEEWAAGTPWQYFTDHDDPELAAAVSAGRAAEFADHGWGGEVPDPQNESTVAASRLRWQERAEPEHAAMLDWYRTLLRLRREEPALAHARVGQGRLEHDREQQTVTLLRGTDQQAPVLVVANLAGQGRTVVLPDWVPSIPWTVVASWGLGRAGDGVHELDPHSVAVLRGRGADDTDRT